MISIIIPTLNEEKAIEGTLRSIRKYSGTCELIVSDGGSRDRTVEIARSIADKVVVHPGPERQNISKGRNKGAEAATGDYIIFWDADVTVPDMDAFIGKAEGYFIRDPKLIALTVSIKVLKSQRTFMDGFMFGLMDEIHRFYNNVLGIGVSPGEFQMVKAWAWKKAGGFDETLAAGEDYEFFKRLSKLGRTRFEGGLTVYHTGRRAHRIGWPRLIFQWSMNGIYIMLFKRSMSDEWKEIR